jgi:hypothetical protein
MTDNDLSFIPYAKVIGACGGVESSTNILAECIDAQVKALEGKVITIDLYIYRFP